MAKVVSKKRKPRDVSLLLDRAAALRKRDFYSLRLFVTGSTHQSARAITHLKRICEEHLHGRYDLKVIDIYQEPRRAREEQIIAAPTLIKQLPAPLRRIIGDLSDTKRVLYALNLEVALSELEESKES